MLIVDSSHLRVLRIPGAASERLAAKLTEDGRKVVTTIINVHEGFQGYLAEFDTAALFPAKTTAYANLQSLIDYFSKWTVLPFDARAAACFDRLLQQTELCKAGTLDLQIAAIALCHEATLLTQNIKFFQNIPGLRMENWLLNVPPDESDSRQD